MQAPQLPPPPQSLSRRDLLRLGLGVLALGLTQVWAKACAPLGGASLGAQASGSPSPLPSVALPPQATGSSGAWAKGTTALIPAQLPDPFTTEPANSATACELLCSATEGPCHAESPVQKDLGEGLEGLPMRMSFQVVQADGCTPIPNATVEVWHTNPAGYYSSFAGGSFCNPTTNDASQAKFCRGIQSTDAQGRVDFDTLFPGWYSSRTVHVHLRVTVANQASVTSQLLFDDALTDEVLAQHPTYQARPKRDTTNANDTVFAASAAPAYLFASRKASGGVLQVWRRLALKAGASCSIPGGSGGGGGVALPGGMPPGSPPAGAPPAGSPPPRPAA